METGVAMMLNWGLR